MIKDQNFYNKESGYYSSKRYPTVVRYYTQFFFKRRLAVTLEMLGSVFQGRSDLSLLEIGCADGIVMRKIAEDMPNVFSDMTGIDTAEDMIVAAISFDGTASATPEAKRSYFVRGKEPAGGSFDAIIEIGVANYTDFDTELAYIYNHLKDNGISILSLAGKGSLNSRMSSGEGYRHILSYDEYERKIDAAFTVSAVIPVGLRIPIIWRMPMLARSLQPFIESICKPIAPDLFHEKIYLLRKK